MKTLIIVLFLTLASNTNFAQTKYFIHFNDKGVNASAKLEAVSPMDLGLTNLAIERRSKVMDKIITEDDLPINPYYIKFLEENSIKPIQKLNWFNAVSAYLTDAQIEFLLKEKFIEKISRVKRLVKSIPQFKTQNSEIAFLKFLGLESNYDYGPSFAQYSMCEIPYIHDKLNTTGKGVIVGIIDAGFNWRNHPSLKDRIVLAEWDFVNNDSFTANDPDEHPLQEGHGTFVFSVIAGFDEGNIVGPAFDAKFILAKTEDVDSETIVEEDNYAAALEWIEKLGADIVTSSLGYSKFDDPEDSYSYADMDGKTAICSRANTLAFERGILCITSAGNDGNKSWRYINAPADEFNTVTIGAVDINNNVTSFSSVGPTSDGRIKPELVAMGLNVYGANSATGEYYFSSGTSYSAPIVAGIAAQIKSFYPNLTNKELRKILIESGDSVDEPNNQRGYGLASVKRALEDSSSVENFILHNNYPNPFYSNTKIVFDSPKETLGNVVIFNALGQKIKNIFSGEITKGRNIFYWNATNSAGAKCASGPYFCIMFVDGKLLSLKMMLLK